MAMFKGFHITLEPPKERKQRVRGKKQKLSSLKTSSNNINHVDTLPTKKIHSDSCQNNMAPSMLQNVTKTLELIKRTMELREDAAVKREEMLLKALDRSVKSIDRRDLLIERLDKRIQDMEEKLNLSLALQFQTTKQLMNLNMRFIQQLNPIDQEIWAQTCNKLLSLNFKGTAMEKHLTTFTENGGYHRMRSILEGEGILESDAIKKIYASEEGVKIEEKECDSKGIKQDNSNRRFSESDLDMSLSLCSMLHANTNIFTTRLSDHTIEFYHDSNTIHTMTVHPTTRPAFLKSSLNKYFKEDILANNIRIDINCRKWHYFPVLDVDEKNMQKNHFIALLCSFQRSVSNQLVLLSITILTPSQGIK